jgi:hypothetical protein
VVYECYKSEPCWSSTKAAWKGRHRNVVVQTTCCVLTDNVLMARQGLKLIKTKGGQWFHHYYQCTQGLSMGTAVWNLVSSNTQA